MHGCPPGFSGFLVAPLIHLTASKGRQKKKKEKENRQCRCLCCEPVDRSALGAILLLKEGLFYALAIDKSGLNVCDEHNI